MPTLVRQPGLRKQAAQLKLQEHSPLDVVVVTVTSLSGSEKLPLSITQVAFQRTSADDIVKKAVVNLVLVSRALTSSNGGCGQA